MGLSVNSPIQYLKGVGEKRAMAYQKMGIFTVNDLLFHFPRHYLDFTNPYTPDTAPLGDIVPVRAVLTYKSPEQRIRKGLSIFRLIAQEGYTPLEITLYNVKYKVDSLRLEQEYIFYGRVEGTLKQRKMNSPELFPLQPTMPIVPVYPQTAGIHTALIKQNIAQVLQELTPIIDFLPTELRSKYRLPELWPSLLQIHQPKSVRSAYHARERFIFDEFLILTLALHFMHTTKAIPLNTPWHPQDLSPFFHTLPYQLTNAQLRCIEEVANDLYATTAMNRLIQGDVGSGKTIVAAAGIYIAAKNNYQSAFMAPTEILAEQHFQTLTKLFAPFHLPVTLLTGSTNPHVRRESLAQIQKGEALIVVGTHALLSEHVNFDRLGLVITDEQHRFGVAQRAALTQKSKCVHTLVMSATPIPRTLSFILYGDLSVSVLDEMPPNRKVVDTLLITPEKLKRALGFVRQHLSDGEQAYIICPLVKQEEGQELHAVIEYSKYLKENDLRGYHIGILHGKMKAAEKEKIMQEFSTGQLQALVATTVVEVGVDVPNATIILVQDAERFGLSQLHQLRGRVGRGNKKSYCILVTNTTGKAAHQRLLAMKQIADGFALAEMDLKLRGPGDFFGHRQHGLPMLKIASFAENMNSLLLAQKCAQAILAQDSTLQSQQYHALRQKVLHLQKEAGDYPN